MKKLHFNLLVICFLSISSVFTSCEKDDDKDPIIGTWINDTKATINGQEFSQITKWVFYEGNNGTYSFEQNGIMDISVSFEWQKSGEFYILNYELAAEDLAEYTKIRISSLLGQKIIETEDELVLAIKE